MEEIRRVLAPGGQAVFVVPNRSGIWARRDATPFGFGRPYSASQLAETLSRHELTVERELAALYMPPSHRGFWLRTGSAAERIGQRLDIQRFAGLRIVEARRRVYVTPQSGAKEAARVPLKVLEGLAPAPKPATGRAVARRHGGARHA